MANTYTKLLVHCVWSTKDRDPLISRNLETGLWRVMAGIAARNGMHALRVGGIEDHVHVLLELPKTVALAKAIQLLKGGSSHWMNREQRVPCRFAWQDGYGGFSVSASNVSKVALYIGRQREHHRNCGFEEEYRALFERHGVEVDERFLLG